MKLKQVYRVVQIVRPIFWLLNLGPTTLKRLEISWYDFCRLNSVPSTAFFIICLFICRSLSTVIWINRILIVTVWEIKVSLLLGHLV